MDADFEQELLPRYTRLIMEETSLGLRGGARSFVVSASYDRFSDGAAVPVQELGSKTLG
jgi:hypothetical protein